MKSRQAKLPPEAKCTRCRKQATIRLPSHHSNVCADCFLKFFETAVLRAMQKFGISAETPLMIAVSGGKDSLSVWNVLHELGFQTRGLHINLGIEGFSKLSSEAVRRFADQRDLPWVEYSLEETFGHTILEVQKRTRRKMCSICGGLKRQMLNRLTIREGFQTLATGHNLDDEAGRLLGNIVRNRFQYLDKQYPFLPSSHPSLPAKLKPLYRLEIHEIRTYCGLKGIEPLSTGCPLSRGATSHTFQEALDFLEEAMPGTKRDFLFSFVNRRKSGVGAAPFNSCIRCGEASYAEICSVCNLREQLEEDTVEAPEARSNTSESACPVKE